MARHVAVAGKDEEEVAQAVEVTLSKRIEGLLRGQCNHAALGTARHGAAYVAAHRGPSTAGQDEPAHGWQLLIKSVDHRLHSFYILLLQAIDRRLHILLLSSKIGTQVEPTSGISPFMA